MIKALLRQPFAILSAFGLLSFAHDAIHWHQYFATWIDAWQAVTRPVVQAIFGWLPAWLHPPFPDWSKDYATMGLIVSGCSSRAILVTYGEKTHSPILTIAYGVGTTVIIFAIATISWPLIFLLASLIFLRTLTRASPVEDRTIEAI